MTANPKRSEPLAVGGAKAPESEEEHFVDVRGVTKRFGSFVALEDVRLSIRRGEFVCILGPSGCGKTTLLRLIAGLDFSDSGAILVGGRDVSREPASKRNCGIVFQSYALFPNLTVEDNVSYGIRRKFKSRDALKQRVADLLRLVDLPSEGRKYPTQLSGGQQQRVALARALAIEPKLLLLDEPLSALDARVRVNLRGEIKRLQRRLGVTAIMVTHDQDEALTMADRIVVMSGGRVVQHAAPSDVYHMPSDPFVADFIGSMNFLGEASVTDAHRVRLAGATLRVERGELANQLGENVLVAIRPEDARLTDDASGENVLGMTVEHVEFRGPIYRLRLLAARDNAHENRRIDLDLGSEAVTGRGLREGSGVHVYLPPSRIHVFRPANRLANSLP